MFIESQCIYHFTYNYSLPRALVKSISFINSVLFRRNEVWIECLETAEPDVAAVVAEDDQRPPPIFIDFKNVEAAEAAAEVVEKETAVTAVEVDPKNAAEAGTAAEIAAVAETAAAAEVETADA